MDNLCEGGVKLPHEHPFYFKDTQIVVKVGEIAWGLVLSY